MLNQEGRATCHSPFPAENGTGGAPLGSTGLGMQSGQPAWFQGCPTASRRRSGAAPRASRPATRYLPAGRRLRSAPPELRSPADAPRPLSERMRGPAAGGVTCPGRASPGAPLPVSARRGEAGEPRAAQAGEGRGSRTRREVCHALTRPGGAGDGGGRARAARGKRGARCRPARSLRRRGPPAASAPGIGVLLGAHSPEPRGGGVGPRLRNPLVCSPERAPPPAPCKSCSSPASCSGFCVTLAKSPPKALDPTFFSWCKVQAKFLPPPPRPRTSSPGSGTTPNPIRVHRPLDQKSETARAMYALCLGLCLHGKQKVFCGSDTTLYPTPPPPQSQLGLRPRVGPRKWL